MAHPGFPPGGERVGAAAREPQRGFMIGGAAHAVLAANTTTYYQVFGGNARGFLTLTDIRVPHNCVMNELRVNINAAAGAGESLTLTLMVEGAGSALTAQIAGAVDVEANDLINQIQVDEDDLISMRVVSSLNANAVNPAWSFKCVPVGN